MIVVSDTSPINYLILIDAVGVLPELYKNIVIPTAVFEELKAEETPEKVREWIKIFPLSLKLDNQMFYSTMNFPISTRAK